MFSLPSVSTVANTVMYWYIIDDHLIVVKHSISPPSAKLSDLRDAFNTNKIWESLGGWGRVLEERSKDNFDFNPIISGVSESKLIVGGGRLEINERAS